MSNLKETEQHFSDLIPNDTGVANKGKESHFIRKEHRRWKQEVREINESRSIGAMSYWHMKSSCSTL